MVVVSVTVFLLFLLYFLTIYYGIWNCKFEGGADNCSSKRSAAWVHTVAFTLVWGLMMWSHLSATTTQAGFMPKGYE